MSTTVNEFQPATSTGRIANFVDTRTGMSPIVKFFARKIFPDHWTFMFGEVALYSFVILLLSGAFLTFFFDPSMSEVVYDGAYAPLRGIEMSAAYASTLDISFDIRGGLLIRQLHHWAALLFVVSIMMHMFRVFFTGAFRKPREINWVIGTLLFMLAIIEGFMGYSLPDDLLSGTGVRAAQGFMLSAPIIGSYLSYAAFGGAFPGEDIIPRLYSLHILLLPAILVALLFRTLDAFRVFDNIYVLTSGSNNTYSVSMLGYDNLFGAFNLGVGSAISILIFICVAIIAFVFIKGFGTAAPGSDAEGR